MGRSVQDLYLDLCARTYTKLYGCRSHQGLAVGNRGQGSTDEAIATDILFLLLPKDLFSAPPIPELHVECILASLAEPAFGRGNSRTRPLRDYLLPTPKGYIDRKIRVV